MEQYGGACLPNRPPHIVPYNRLLAYAPWHFLYFFPLPQGQGSLRPILLAAMVRADAAATGARPCPCCPCPLERLPPPCLRAADVLARSSLPSVFAWPLALAISSRLV